MDNIKNPNIISLICRVTVSGTKIPFLGDADYISCGLLATKMGDDLGCDICQLAHHGLDGGHYRLYEAAKPKMLLVPMSRPAYDAMIFGEYRDASGTSHNRNIIKSVPEHMVKLSCEGDLVIELPLNIQ